jgi:uncharacterized protein YoxC
MEVTMKPQRKSRLENKSASYKQKLRQSRQKARDLAKRNRDLTKRKDYYKSRTKELTQELQKEKDLKQKGCLGVSDRSIAKHHYTEMLVKLTVGLVMVCGCSLRSTVKIIEFLNELLGWHLPSIPCFRTVQNWLEKSGYAVYTEPKKEEFSEGYACIVDESMMMGGQKLLLTLGVLPSKSSETALTFGDVTVLDMSVQSSWNSAGVSGVLTSITSTLEQSPTYVISDNASILCKAFCDNHYVHVQDVGHTIALSLEHVYKEDDLFKEMVKEIAAVKSREVMRPTAYLLPPKQRTIARFMNISDTMDWAAKVLLMLPLLTKEEQNVFDFLNQYRDLIAEWQELVATINPLLKRLKEKGLSVQTMETSLEDIKRLQHSSRERLRKVGNALAQYFQELKRKLPKEETTWHCSSDIIESLFGYYKNRKSPNPMNGVTKQILWLPLTTAIDSKNGVLHLNFKEYLEKNTLANINKWRESHLPKNQTLKRKNVLKNTHAML